MKAYFGEHHQKFGDVDKIDAIFIHNWLILLILRHFYDMVKKFVFSVVVKSRRKMVFY